MSTLNGGPGNIVTNGLVMYLDAANYASYTSGSLTWYDLTKNNNSGSLVNGPTFDSSNGGSIVFDGVNDYVSAPFTSTLTLFTLNLWVKVPGAQTTDMASILISRVTSPQTTGINFYSTSYGGDGLKLTYHYNGTGYTWGGGPSLVPNIWTNITLVYGSTTVSYYVNGLFYSSNSYTISTVNLSALNIGRDSSIFPRYYNGNIATTQIYNRALTASEVLQNYNAQKTRFGLT